MCSPITRIAAVQVTTNNEGTASTLASKFRTSKACSIIGFASSEHALEVRNLEARVEAVPSLFFGGNIGAAGLLTVRDFLAKYEQIGGSGYEPDVVTLPKRAFDPWGRDLEGISYRSFEQISGKPVVLA